MKEILQKRLKLLNQKNKKKSKFIFILPLCFVLLGISGCDDSIKESAQNIVEEEDVEASSKEDNSLKDEENKTTHEETIKNQAIGYTIQGNILKYKEKSYDIKIVDGGDRSGTRQKNIAVDIGFGDRNYWALTNEYGQLVYVLADQITLQDDNKEDVNSSGRYYHDEANVPGTERSDLDQGHIIADSLGGVANAYNITPQDSTLNRHGDQAYMEENIRDANGCENFVATITYPDTNTQIPSNYNYQYILKGNKITDDFPNANPEGSTNNDSNQSVAPTPVPTPTPEPTPAPTPNVGQNIVYWTPNGKSYHIDRNCFTLNRSKTVLEGALSTCPKTDPCDHCH